MSVAILPPPSQRFSLRSLPTPLLVRQLDTLAAQELATDADVLAHLAELEVREEFLRLGYSSMQDYCVRRLRMSEDRANKRIRVCRTALEFPVIFEMIADGRLHLGSVLILATHLSPSNAAELLASSVNLTRVELEFMLARRFPRVGASSDAPALELTCGIAGNSDVEVAPGPPPVLSTSTDGASSTEPLPTSHARAPQPAFFAKFTPLSGEHVQVRGQLSMVAYEHFQSVRALASHAVPSGNAALVIEYALKLAAALLDKRKFGSAARTRPRDGKPDGRYIPAPVRRAVCERDGGRCTYVGPDGTRCGSEWHLEFDHIVTFAEGGETTVDNLRLLCRRHNQLEAKRRLGAPLIAARIEQARAEAVREKQRREQREAAAVVARSGAKCDGRAEPMRERAEVGAAGKVPERAATDSAPERSTTTTRERGADRTPAVTHAAAPASSPHTTTDTANAAALEAINADIVAALRTLRFTIAEAKRGVEITAHMLGASAEQRTRAALQKLGRAKSHRESFA